MTINNNKKIDEINEIIDFLYVDNWLINKLEIEQKNMKNKKN